MAVMYEKEEVSKISSDISSMRAPYRSYEEILREQTLFQNPLKLFNEWFEAARKCSKIEEPNAMCLATCTKDGYPSARYVLLKHFDEDGFTFFTNYNSRKGKELEENPRAAVVFYWEPLRRSVRIEGTVSKVPESISVEYFGKRPKESQLGAAVSDQSMVIENRDVLDNELIRLRQLYENTDVPRPKWWGGYVIKPQRIEFWQGQSNRLHDRISFRKPINDDDKEGKRLVDGNWIFERLAP